MSDIYWGVIFITAQLVCAFPHPNFPPTGDEVAGGVAAVTRPLHSPLGGATGNLITRQNVDDITI